MESDAGSSGGEVRRKSSQRMDDDSSLGTYSLSIKNVREGWKMLDKEEDLQGKERGLFPKDGKRSKEDKFIKINNIRKDIKKVYKIIYRLSDGVIEHERMEEDIEEYINVMVYQEESIDVDVDKKTINHSKACGKCRNLSNECS